MMETINSLFASLKGDFGFIEGWVLQIFFVVLGALLVEFLQRIALKRLARRADRQQKSWIAAMLRALRAPLSLLIWLLGLTTAATIAGQQSESPLFDYVPVIRQIGVILALTWFALRTVRAIERIVLQRAREQDEDLDQTTVDAIGKLVRISVVITALLVVLQNLGFSISGVLAFGGIGGLAVGLAARDMLANFFGGLTIFMDRPLSVGDWIRSPDREIEGTVEKIGWRQTRIRTFEKRPLYVPNATFTTVVVENPSRMTNRRIYETIGVRYADFGAMRDIVSDVEEMLRDHDEIEQQQTLMVFFNQFASSSLDFFVYCFTKTVNWAEYHRVKQDVLFRVGDIIESHGGEIAFPTHTVHLASTPQDAGLEDSEPEPVTSGPRASGDESRSKRGPGGQYGDMSGPGDDGDGDGGNGS